MIYVFNTIVYILFLAFNFNSNLLSLKAKSSFIFFSWKN